VGDAEGAEGALEFALRVAAVAAGAWAEEAEGIGVDGLGMPWFSKAERKWQKWFQVVSAETKRAATLRPE